MEGGNKTRKEMPHLLHSDRVYRRVNFNRAFALVYAIAILALLYHHTLNLILHSTTNLFIFFIHISMLISDVVLALMWFTTQTFRIRPVVRDEYPENLGKIMRKQDFPGLDIFICTADPYKEPPVHVVNTALSVMAYDYPTEKISVYVSDDGGSELTLFAFMEAAKFGKHWLPFCRENHTIDRNPHVYFQSSNYKSFDDNVDKIKDMYESMKRRVESVVERGSVPEEYLSTQEELQAFSKFRTPGFSRHDHPTVIQVLLEKGKDEDVSGWCCTMPNLIYVSREKSITTPHHFKAGALNTLLRVSATMTNAPIILTLDCDMYSHDPTTPRRALCHLMGEGNLGSNNLGFVQFPQRFHGVNKSDIYACEFKRLFQINPRGMDGLSGTSYVGTGCFFRRRAFFGAPSSFIPPEIQELSPHHQLVNNHDVKEKSVLDLAHHVAGCNYENNHTNWGSKIGFRYGSLVEDYNTGYRLQCEGWRSRFCHPEREAFLGDIPISLFDILSQTKRWAVGLLEVGVSKYSPLTYGVRSMGLWMGLSYAHYAFWAIFSIPVTIYSFLPQLSLLHGITIFPKVSSLWFFLYVFLFVGAYGQDWLDFILAGGTKERWWNDQRMWIIRSLSSYFFGTSEYIVKHLGIATHGFNVTSKVVDDEQSKRYDQGIFEFGVASPLFVPLVMAATLNLVALFGGLSRILRPGENLDGLFLQMLICVFGVSNSLPIYQGMVLRSDKGKIHSRTISISIFLVFCLYAVFSCLVKISA